MTAAEWSQSAAALASIALMGVCGLRLLRGLGRLLQGREAAWGRPAGALPLHGMAKSGAAMLTSRLLLLANGQEILWIAGRRRTSHYPVTDRTKRILYFQIKEKRHTND